jgi:hypothetical protein
MGLFSLAKTALPRVAGTISRNPKFALAGVALAAPQATGSVLGQVGSVFGNVVGGVGEGMFGDNMFYVWIVIGFFIFIILAGLFVQYKASGVSNYQQPQYIRY